MEVTINKKKPEEVIKELKKDFDESFYEKGFNGFISVNVQHYLDRLDKVVGLFNYDIETIETIVTEQSILKSVKITIFDDNRNIIKVATGDGGAEFIVPAGSDKQKDPDNTNDTAFSDAFKRACRRLGIGLDVYRLNRKLAGKDKISKNTKCSRAVTGEIEEFHVIFTEPLVASQKNSYTAKVKDETGEYSLVLWEREVEIMQNTYFEGKSYFDMFKHLSDTKGKAKFKGVFQLYGRGDWPQIVYKEAC